MNHCARAATPASVGSNVAKRSAKSEYIELKIDRKHDRSWHRRKIEDEISKRVTVALESDETMTEIRRRVPKTPDSCEPEARVGARCSWKSTMSSKKRRRARWGCHCISAAVVVCVCVCDNEPLGRSRRSVRNVSKKKQRHENGRCAALMRQHICVPEICAFGARWRKQQSGYGCRRRRRCQ